MAAYPILQSGFVSMTEEGLTKPDLKDSSLAEKVLLKSHTRLSNKYFYRKDISNLFSDWLKDPKLARDFDFREKTIVAAIKAFGINNVQKWFIAQNNMNTISDLHRVFISETLAYISLGTSRNISNVQWVSLLETAERTNSVPIDVSTFFPDENAKNNNVRLPVTISEFINRWMDKEDGFTDMLVCLQAIFGERKQKFDVSDLPDNA